MLTAHEPSIKPLANIVSCYICSDRQYKRKNTFHFSHLPSRINGRARPQTHYTTLFAKKIQETMPRAEFSDRGKSLSSYNLSVSLRSTAPLVGEPLAKRRSFPLCQGLPSVGEVARRRRDGEVELLSQRESLCLRALREFVENARQKREEFVKVIKMRRRY